MSLPKPADYSALAMRESPDAVLVLSHDGEILHWSAGAEAVFGFGEAQAKGRRLTDLIVPDDRRADEELLLAEAFKSGRTLHESLRRRSDGALVCVEVSRKAISDSARMVVLSTERDVTLVKAARDAKQVEARFGELLESTPDGIVMVNPTGHVVFANAHAARLFGYAAVELRGRPVEILLPEAIARGTSAIVRAISAPHATARWAPAWNCTACARTAASSRSRSA